ncbi:MAG TPA: hypothetical protein VN176_03570 [Verrucomicrobiae bacterium]|nr:hypothetical protein [Verrucomicrobiae bacterium]
MSQAKGKVLIGLGSAAVIACGIAFFCFHARGNVPSFSAAGNAFPSAAGTAQEIYGGYLFVHESSGSGPAKGAEVVLKFMPPNVVTVRATKPGETLTAVGTFTLEDQKISLTIAELGKNVSKGSYSYDGTQLVLPMLIIQDGDGTSTWKKISIAGDPLRAAVEYYYANVVEQGRAATLQKMAQQIQRDSSVRSATVYNDKVMLVTYGSGYREFFLAPPVSDAPRTQSANEARAETRGTGNKQSRFSSNNTLRPRIVPVQFLPGGAGAGPAGQLLNPAGRFDKWLEPEPQPVSRGDAPSEKVALVLGPFHSLPILVPGGQGIHYQTFSDAGEDLEFVAKQLKANGYQIDGDGPYYDATVTVKMLYQLLHNKPWGVFYFSTHGGIWGEDFLLSTGQQLPADLPTPEKREEYLDEYLRESLPGDLGPELYKQLKDNVTVGIVGDVAFVSITSGFFHAAGADFSSGLVYMSGCETAQTRVLRDAMNARSFVGWKTDTANQLSADMSKAFWRCLGRKTRSDREAMDFGINYLLEAEDYGSMVRAHKGPEWDPNNLVVYRQGKAEPEKPFAAIQHLMLYTVRDYAWRQSHVGGGQEDLHGLVDKLYQCKEEKPGGTDAGGISYCRQAMNGVQVPDSQIDEVKGELCGYGKGQPRFTLFEAQPCCGH